MHANLPSIHEIAEYLDGLLETQSVPDYPGAVNGLQLENAGPIRGVTAAVDFSTRAIDAAIETNANLLVVHHGMFWGGATPLKGASYNRLRKLFEHDIGVYSSHLPLDRHPTFGNNVLLAKELGLEPTASFAQYEGSSIGVRGSCDVETETILKTAIEFSKANDTVLRSTRFAERRRTLHWAICTGAGASADTLKEARELGIDTLIVGEGPHWTAVEAEEQGLCVIYAGHYATETLGVREFSEHLATRYGIPSSFARASTGL
jgi:dinuclear metal center YbgI/SA1388 family protein